MSIIYAESVEPYTVIDSKTGEDVVKFSKKRSVKLNCSARLYNYSEDEIRVGRNGGKFITHQNAIIFLNKEYELRTKDMGLETRRINKVDVPNLPVQSIRVDVNGDGKFLPLFDGFRVNPEVNPITERKALSAAEQMKMFEDED